MKWNKQKSRKKNKKKKESKNSKKLNKLKNTWNDKYKCNAIGKASEMNDFIQECDIQSIYHSKPQSLIGAYKIVYFNKKTQQKITQIAKRYQRIIINADIITARRIL